MIIFIGLAILCILFGRVVSRKNVYNNCFGSNLTNNLIYRNNKLLGKQNKAINFFSVHSILPILLLMFFFTFRAYSVGSDTNNYLNYFLQLKNGSSLNPFVFFNQHMDKEIGFVILNYLVLLTCPNFTFFLFIESLIIFVPLYFLIKRYSIRPELTYFMFIVIGNYAQSFNITRQYICMIFLLLSLKYVFERKPFKFLFFVTLGFMFHSSALVFVVVYPLYSFRMDIKFVLVSFVLTILIVLLFDPLLKIMSFLMEHDYYGAYGPTSPHMVRYGLDNLILNLIYIFAFIILFIFRKKVKLHCPRAVRLYEFFLKMFLCYVCIKILAFAKGDLIERVGLYFSISLIFLIPLFVFCQDNCYKKFIYTSVLLGGVLFMTYVIFIRGAYCVLPYKTIFSALFK